MKKISTTICLSIISYYPLSTKFQSSIQKWSWLQLFLRQPVGLRAKQSWVALVGTYQRRFDCWRSPILIILIDLFDVVHQGAGRRMAWDQNIWYMLMATNETGQGVFDHRCFNTFLTVWSNINSLRSSRRSESKHWTHSLDRWKGRLFVFGGNGNGSPYSGYSCFDLTAIRLILHFSETRKPIHSWWFCSWRHALGQWSL